MGAAIPGMDGWMDDPSTGMIKEQQGIGRTKSTLQKSCFVLASQPGAALGRVRAAFVGLPAAPGTPLAAHSPSSWVAFLPLIGLGRRRLPRTAWGDLGPP